MKLSKKLLAVILTISVLLAMVVIPASAFTGSTATMPTDFTVIENFDGENTLGWEAHGSTLEFSDAYGYGTEGKSAHVSWSASGWQGFKTKSNVTITLEKTGLAFWAYNAGSDLSSFCVVLLQGNTKYEAKITLKAGEAIYQIPWTDFVKNGVSVDTTQTVRQIDFTKSAASADYYIDQIGCYTGDAVQSEFVASTIAMPDNYTAIDNFDSVSALNWEANKSTAELSADRGYGKTGKSMHVTWSASGWCGFKTSSNQSISLSGDGLAFWAYNAGNELTNFAIVLLQGDVKYEAKITLKAGEGVYQIPWTDFVKNDASVDKTAIVRQIEFTKSAGSANYYIDELSCYSNYIPSTLEMPADFTVIDDFNGENTLGWASTNKATLKIAAERGYGAEGNGAHVSWNEKGWSGFKTASGKNIALTGDGLAFWAYNAGNELSGLAIVLLQDGVKYEAKITLKAGEAIYKIPFADFVKNDAAIDTAKTVSQIEFTKSADSADYFIDQLGCYADPKKPAVSTVLFDTSVKSSSSAIAGSGKGGNGGFDTVKWKLYDIENDPRFTRGCWFIAEDVTAGLFNFISVTPIGTLEGVDISSAYYFGNLNFWIKSEVADRTLKVALKDKTSGKYSDYVEFKVTEAGKWQQVTIPVKEIVSEELLNTYPEFLKNVDVVSFTGRDVAGTFQFGEEFKIAGVKVWDSDVPDYSEYADLDTEPTQPEDDGSYNPDSEIIGQIDFTMDSYSGNGGFGKVTKETFDDFATAQNGIKIVAGEGIKDDKMATKGLSVWFGEDGTANTIDLTTLEDGYFSMWVRGSRAGMSFYYILFDDTDNDAKTSIVKTYTIKEANTWEEVRIRICDFVPNGALDNEYVFKMQIRTGYGSFNWSKAYQDEQWLNTGDVLEVACARVTEGKPVDPFAAVDTGDDGNDDGDGSTDTGDDTNTNTGTGTGSSNTGSNNTNAGSGTNTGTGSTDETTNDNTAGGTSPVTGESAMALVMLLTFVCINGVIAAFAKSRIKAK